MGADVDWQHLNQGGDQDSRVEADNPFEPRSKFHINFGETKNSTHKRVDLSHSDDEGPVSTRPNFEYAPLLWLTNAESI
jgi:hypothetical protein